MYFFTADQHFYHENIIEYCNRQFQDVEEMTEKIISNYNEVVGKSDHVIHAGDFAFINNKIEVQKIINRLNGNKIFLKGCHDKWMPNNNPHIWRKTIEKQPIVVCHYNMRTWPRSHYGSWQLFAHSHGTLDPVGKQHDVGVDNNDFYPVSFDEIDEIMKNKQGEIMADEKKENEKIYVMLFQCANCFKEFRQSILFGCKAIDNGGSCPYCGVSFSGNSNIKHKPLEYVEV